MRVEEEDVPRNVQRHDRKFVHRSKRWLKLKYDNINTNRATITEEKMKRARSAVTGKE